MDILATIAQGVKAVAPTVANLVIPGSGPLLHGLMRMVTGDSAETPIEQTAAAIAADPAKLAELNRIAADREVRLRELESKDLATVNSTMQVEAKSEHWPQYSWRPFNGFTYPLAVIMIYFVLPMLEKVVPNVPQWIWLGWLSILGVATFQRGKEKRAAAGDVAPGMLSGAIRAIRGQ